MTAARTADLQADHRRLVAAVLAKYLPRGAKVWVFGSRATGRARPFSDLDLAIDAGQVLSLDEFACLAEAFCESDLPYRVDLVDWHSLDEGFRRIIAADRVAPAAAANLSAGTAV